MFNPALLNPAFFREANGKNAYDILGITSPKNEST
jgi:hypothetical protein